ncbi:MAG TPA: hypothetical protein DCL77_03380 [Prolixibacteraceae bacterium]|jgi:hypothetical protein|nr:hypothetical protein [Prolixibacteraceae bacterium]
MMKKTWIVAILMLTFAPCFAQSDSLKVTNYSFIVRDSPSQFFSMRQLDQNYLSGYRLLTRQLYSITGHDLTAYLLQVGIQALFLRPITHEEAHRSILGAYDIGSISSPFTGDVNGVTDLTLMNLRDHALPTFIRLHTAGLESDYMLTRQLEQIASFEHDDFKNYMIEYWLRQIAMVQYYALGLFKYDPELVEDKNELKRDIAGFDTYGAARHLFRPAMPFFRYTDYADLTLEERKFINRLGYRSFLNLLNPLIIGKSNFRLNANTSFNAGMGYSMSPFGDFMDENVWIKHKSLNLGIYVRQFQNKANWFNGFGISLIDFHPFNRLSANFTGHYWQQPINFDFNTSKSFSGGAFDADLRYLFLKKRIGVLNGVSIDLGFLYKTKGFLPEETRMDEHVGFRFGTTIQM